jgi:hypothetical protein
MLLNVPIEIKVSCGNIQKIIYAPLRVQTKLTVNFLSPTLSALEQEKEIKRADGISFEKHCQ